MPRFTRDAAVSSVRDVVAGTTRSDVRPNTRVVGSLHHGIFRTSFGLTRQYGIVRRAVV